MTINWLTDATDDRLFTGTLDGAGHIIYGLYINTNNVWYAGLFPRLANATIKNLGISKSRIMRTEWNDSVVGAFAGEVLNNVTFSNCFVDDTVYVQNVLRAGGFVGNCSDDFTSLTIENCYSAAIVKATGSANCQPAMFVGGHRSWNGRHVIFEKIKIINSYAVGSARLAPSYVADGKDYTATITNCYTTFKNTDTKSPEKATVLTEAKMKGDNAKQNMQGFDFNTVWRVVPRDFPELQKFPEVQTGPADPEAPKFEGEISALGTTKTSITVTWPEATDNITPSAFISYEVLWSESQIDAGNVAAATSLGTYKFTREATLTATDTSKDYYIAVRATDELGNETLR